MESIGLLGQMGGKVGLGAALAWAFAAAARRLRPGQLGRRSPSSLRVVETTALGPNRALHLVAVNGRSLLIGSGPSRVDLLADVTDEHPAAETAAEDGREDFAAMLSHLLAGRPLQAQAEGSPIEPPPPCAGRADHVERLRAAAAALRGTVPAPVDPSRGAGRGA